MLLVVNYVIDSGLLRIKYRQGFGKTWKEIIEPYLLSDALNVLTAGLGVLALLEYGTVAALVVVAGSIGSQALVYSSREQVKENDELRTRVDSLEEALATSNMQFGTIIIQDLGRRDGYTHRHAAATAVYASDLGRELKLGDTRAEQLRMAGLLHNIGLFGLPEELLLVTGKLNSVAQSRLAEHPARGEEALAAIPEFEEMASWVRWHHERPDGRGYPDKLRGPWIPLEAKILAVAQAYAAMVLDQPRRPGMSFAEAREKLSAGIDTEFDGIVVRALLRILETESEGYRMADDHRFVFPAPDHRRRARPALSEDDDHRQIRAIPHSTCGRDGSACEPGVGPGRGVGRLPGARPRGDLRDALDPGLAEGSFAGEARPHRHRLCTGRRAGGGYRGRGFSVLRAVLSGSAGDLAARDAREGRRRDCRRGRRVPCRDVRRW
jgi:hypothetical protein